MATFPTQILHLAYDEKFIDLALDIFCEAFPHAAQEVLIFSKTENLVHVTKRDYVKIINPALFDPRQIRISRKLVVIHFLSPQAIQLIELNNNHPFYLWMPWGGDFYPYIDYPQYGPLTLDYLIQKQKDIPYLQRLKKNISKLRQKKRRKAAIKRIRYIAPVIDEDFEIITRSIPFVEVPQKVFFKYLPIQSSGLKEIVPRSDGQKIIVGNSAYPTNNHLEILEVLGRIKPDQELVFPLNYGDFEYRNFIIEKIQSYHFRKVKILDTFLEKSAYYDLIGQCGIMIMNHRRQQALINIIAGLYFGKKVILNAHSPVFSFCQKLGLKVFTLDQLDDQLLRDRLPQDVIDSNKKIVEKEYDKYEIIGGLRTHFSTWF